MIKNKIVIYKTQKGREPFIEWLHGLDKAISQRIRRRIAQIELGNFGDCSPVGNGVYELRFFFSSGYRVYYGIKESTIVLFTLRRR